MISKSINPWAFDNAGFKRKRLAFNCMAYGSKAIQTYEACLDVFTLPPL